MFEVLVERGPLADREHRLARRGEVPLGRYGRRLDQGVECAAQVEVRAAEGADAGEGGGEGSPFMMLVTAGRRSCSGPVYARLPKCFIRDAKRWHPHDTRSHNRQRDQGGPHSGSTRRILVIAGCSGQQSLARE